MADNVVKILVEVDNSKAKSEILNLEKEIKNLVGTSLGPAGATVGIWEQAAKGVDPLIANLRQLKKEFADLRKVTASAGLKDFSAETVRQAMQLERYNAIVSRAAVANEKLALAQQRTATESARTAKVTNEAAVVEAKRAVLLERSAAAAIRNQKATLDLKMKMEAFNSTKDREMARLAKNENLLLRNKIMAERLAKGYYTARRSISSLGTAHVSLLGKVRSLIGGFTRLAAGLGIIISTGYALRAIYRSIFETFKLGIDTMDMIRLKSASMAGAMLIAQPKMNFKEALAQADSLLLKSFTLSRQFVGSARELQVLMEAMATFGVKIDLTTEKGQKQFVDFANTLKLVTQGQNFEIQAFQEIRALMQGQNFQGAMIARRLQAMGINARKMVPIWVEQGVFLEKIVELMGGYAQATAAIEDTLYSQRKLTESIVSLIMMKGLSQAYDDIKNTLVSINWTLLGNERLTSTANQIVARVRLMWIGVRDAITAAIPNLYTFYKIMKDVLAVQKWILSMLWKITKATLEAASTLKDKYLGAWETAINVIFTKSAADKIIGWFKGIRDKIHERYSPPEMLTNWVKEQQARYAEDEFGRQMEMARRTRWIKDEQGNVLDYYLIEPPALSPSAKNVALETEAMHFYDRLKEVLKKGKRDLAAASGDMANTVTGSIEKARNKIIDEFSKLYTNAQWDTVARKHPEIAAAIKKLDLELQGQAQYNAYKKWFDKIERVVVDSDASVDAIFTKHLQRYDTYDEQLQQKLRTVDTTVNALAKKIRQSFEKLLPKRDPNDPFWFEGLTPDEQKFYAIMDAILGKLKQYKKAWTEKEIIDAMIAHRKYINAINLELADLVRKAQEPGAPWPWEADALERQQKFAENLHVANELWNKLGDDLKSNKVTPQEYLDRYQRISDLLDAMNKKTIEETDKTRKIVTNAWSQMFSDIGQFTKSFFVDVLGGQLKTLSDYFDAFTDIVRNAWASLISDMINEWIKAQFGKTIGDTFKGAGNWLFSILGLAAGAGEAPASVGFEAWSPGMWGAKAGAMLSGPFVPVHAFASGGVVNRPMLGMVGEGGTAEAVIPLRGGKVPVEMRGGKEPVNVNFYVTSADAKDFDRLLYERRNIITGMIQQEIRNAHSTRDAIRRHAL